MWQRIRSLLFWLHLSLGVLISIVALTLCITGTLLALEVPVTQWADRQLIEAPGGEPSGGAPSVEQIAAAIEAGEPRPPQRITLGRDPQDPAVVSYGRHDDLYFHPRTGEALGAGAASVHGAFRALMLFHRWFSLEGEGREVGKAIVGVSTLIFVVLTISGAFLWLPRKWRWKNVKAVLLLRRGLKGKARDFNWHHVFGFWFLIPLLFFGVTGAAIGYAWLNQGLVELAGGEVSQGGHGGPPKGRGRPGGPPGGPGGAPAAAPATPLKDRLAGVDAALAEVVRQTPGWRRISVDVPADTTAPWSITADQGNGRQPQHQIKMTVSRDPIAVTERSGWGEASISHKVRRIIRFGHTGEIAGWIGILIAALASAAGVLLSITGVSLSWRRYSRWRGKRAARAS